MEALDRSVAQVTKHNAVLDPETPGPVRSSDGRSIWIEPIKAHLTDQRILDQEEHIIDFAEQARAGEPTVSHSVDTKGLDTLQADAARAVAGDGRLVLIVGPAGTGKTTTLARAVDDLNAAGRPVPPHPHNTAFGHLARADRHHNALVVLVEGDILDDSHFHPEQPSP
ncbi:MAG: AAA family ATPase [Acidimicrobiia bacterium]|nr:AAA family ATPase [Acidimicrobiia bacterium]